MLIICDQIFNNTKITSFADGLTRTMFHISIEQTTTTTKTKTSHENIYTRQSRQSFLIIIPIIKQK